MSLGIDETHRADSRHSVVTEETSKILYPHKEKSMSSTKRVAIQGTEHASIPGSRAIGPTDPHQIIEVSVLLKHRRSMPEPENEGQQLSYSDFAKTYGAEPPQIDKLREFAREHKLQVLERGDEVLRRTVTLAGAAAAMEKAFGVELTEYEYLTAVIGATQGQSRFRKIAPAL